MRLYQTKNTAKEIMEFKATTELEKMFANHNHISDKESMSKISKKLLQLKSKIRNKTLK